MIYEKKKNTKILLTSFPILSKNNYHNNIIKNIIINDNNINSDNNNIDNFNSLNNDNKNDLSNIFKFNKIITNRALLNKYNNSLSNHEIIFNNIDTTKESLFNKSEINNKTEINKTFSNKKNENAFLTFVPIYTKQKTYSNNINNNDLTKQKSNKKFTKNYLTFINDEKFFRTNHKNNFKLKKIKKEFVKLKSNQLTHDCNFFNRKNVFKDYNINYVHNSYHLKELITKESFENLIKDDIIKLKFNHNLKILGLNQNKVIKY